ncbi:hypothetical protein DSECCO2_550040 [anaerobic digester metagenome]
MAAGQKRAQGVGQGEGHGLAVAVVELLAVGVLAGREDVEGGLPDAETRGHGRRAGFGIGRGHALHLGDVVFEVHGEDVAGHGDRELAALHALGAFVGGFELAVVPLVEQEPGAVLGDAVAAHERHGLAHDGRAVAGVPELAGRAEHAGLGFKRLVLDHRVGVQGGEAGGVARLLGGEKQVHVFRGLGQNLFERRELRAHARDAGVGQGLFLELFRGVEVVEQPRRGEAHGRAGLTRGPELGQADGGVLLLLQAQFVLGRALGAGVAAAETAALVADDRLHGGEQLGRGHERHGHARAVKHRSDDLGVGVVGHDAAVFHRVAADDAAGRHLHAEDRVAGGGQLVDHLERGRAAVEQAGVGLFQDDHARGLDARVGGVHGHGGEIGEVHARDEAAALVDLEHGLLAFLPGIDSHLADEHAGVHADVGQGLGQAERAAPGGLVRGRGAQAHVVVALFGGAALVDGRQGQVARQGAGGRAGVHPGQFEGDQGQGHVLGPLDEAALVRVEEDGGDAGLVEGGEQLVFLLVPFVGVARALGHQPGDQSPRHGAGGLDGHLEVEAVRETPHDLPDVVARKGAESFHRFRLIRGLGAPLRMMDDTKKYGRVKYSFPCVNWRGLRAAHGPSGGTSVADQCAARACANPWGSIRIPS